MLALITSCDDGDILITSFDFEETNLEVCNGTNANEYVFFKINKDSNESISLNFIDADYNATLANTSKTSQLITLALNTQENSLIYRQFNTTVANDYYCNTIPPSNIVVTEELIGISGTAEILTQIVLEEDNDGIPSEEEDLNNNGNLEDDDTDGDGIPNYKDQDDDNDNIPTSSELPNSIPDDDRPKDTDKDGIPDYLDADDDNDGILTLFEDTNYTANEGNPRDDDTDDDGIPDYLDIDTATANLSAQPNLNNLVKTTYRTTVNISNIVFDKNNENYEDDNFSFGYRETTKSIKTIF